MTIESGSWSIASTSIRWRAQVEEKVANRSCHDRFIFSLSSTYCSTLERKRRSFFVLRFPSGIFHPRDVFFKRNWLPPLCVLQRVWCNCCNLVPKWDKFFSPRLIGVWRGLWHGIRTTPVAASKRCTTTTPVWPDLPRDVLLLHQCDQMFKQMYYSSVTRCSSRCTTPVWPDFPRDVLLLHQCDQIFKEMFYYHYTSVTRSSKRCTTTPVLIDFPQITQK